MNDESHERELAHSRQVIATAKLVVTFSAAIAATFVATSLQGRDENYWDDSAAFLMLLTLVLTIYVVLLPSRHHKGDLGHMSDLAFQALQTSTQRAHRLMVAQVALSVLASAVAALGLLAGDWHWIK
jgi:hypothetical protein